MKGHNFTKAKELSVIPGQEYQFNRVIGNLSNNEKFSIGAEASIYLCKYIGLPAILKIRLPKKYRIQALDISLRKRRIIQESRLLFSAYSVGASVPVLYDLSSTSFYLIQEYIDGTSLKEIINSSRSKGSEGNVLPSEMSSEDYLQQLNFFYGKNIGRLHINGIIHGDLTSSNAIVRQEKKNTLLSEYSLVIIDFGLGKKSSHLEDQAVDLLVYFSCLQSSHYWCTDSLWSSFIEGYKAEVGSEKLKTVLDRINVIVHRRRHT